VTTVLPTSTLSLSVSRIFQRILTALPQTTLTVTTSAIDIIPFEVLPPEYRQHTFVYTPSYAGTLTRLVTHTLSVPPIYLEAPLWNFGYAVPIAASHGARQLERPPRLADFILDKDGMLIRAAGLCTTIVACQPVSALPTTTSTQAHEQASAASSSFTVAFLLILLQSCIL
jgi:hypothetical protein